MEFVYWLFWGLRSVFSIFPVEVALTLGLVFFGLSWIRRRPIVSLPASGRRRKLLRWLGIGGALAIVTVATATTWLSYLHTFPDPSGFGGWLRRPLPLVTVALVVTAFAIALRLEPLPAPGERKIAPRQWWWTFVPPPLLWTTSIATALLLLTSLWQTAVGTRAPADADLYGNVPSRTDLPVFVPLQENMGYFAGAGWPNHLATLAAVLLATAVLIFTLGRDANRPISIRAAASDVRAEHAATARVLAIIVLGGILLTLGAVWGHVGYIGGIMVGVDDPPEQGGALTGPVVGSSYQAFAWPMSVGGYVIQGIGAALLLRLAFDTWRVTRAQHGSQKPDVPSTESARGSTESASAPGTSAGSVQSALPSSPEALRSVGSDSVPTEPDPIRTEDAR
ncbi:MAG: hypothetical protein ACK5LO_13775 [Leucobacter sp.]